jgi:molybdopterin-biosynthesis enzyme MoeA-like protein
MVIHHAIRYLIPAKYCFELGIELKRIEVIADDEGEIIEAVRRMSNNYDMVVTSGGIGATHDDLVSIAWAKLIQTYPSIAKAFNQSLVYHEETLQKMAQLSERKFDNKATDEATIARKRMALFPSNAEVLFPSEDLWVPVVIVNRNVFILPGVPKLFTTLLSSLKPSISCCVPPGRRQYRFIIATEEPESAIAPFLEKLQKRVADQGIKVGSYPKWQGGVKVSLLGRDTKVLEGLVEEVEKGINGVRVRGEDEEKEEKERREAAIGEIKRGVQGTKTQ